ncbi:short chain dehydrogenase [Vibrio ichthyoenteri ATCC 700023]|uniref:Short chain dehydrogenase n=1 Tax=Vibrio ichthyoenteri ATCC 700023 TaxID=870968 RepID=F9S6W4_9VIBR|nr:SDR family NAD(P)-dependent oxidoreductase [Vibrio ichthyoenteri]EGU32245.1 short chain dehydrogenase [Vibrio ichthyoenteri ATCC 700023]
MKTVFITGATSGIGYQLAADYLNSGARVVACGRNQAALDTLHTDNHSLETLCFDLTNREQTQHTISAMQSSPDVWIFNAGDCEYIEKGELDSELIRRVFEVNVMGLVHAIEAAQTHFTAGTHVVVVGSISSELALPRAEAYGASKSAVSYLARTLQQTLKPRGVRVTVVYPGFVRTPLTQKNTFAMPMMVEVEQASKAIREGIERGSSYIYFPTRFTLIIRLLSLLPYRWQNLITAKLIQE